MVAPLVGFEYKSAVAFLYVKSPNFKLHGEPFISKGFWYWSDPSVK